MSHDPVLNLVPWVVFLPLIGLLLNLVFGRRLAATGRGGETAVGLIATLATTLAFVVSLLLAGGLQKAPEAVVVPFAEWITAGSFSLNWSFRVDTLAVTMMLVVSGVGALIHLYATAYMQSDVRFNGDAGRYTRFFVYFNLFIVAMMVLVSANNYLMLFVGWEGVGLCSYLLIGFWYEKGLEGVGNARAAKKAFIVNRVGDFGLLMAMFAIFWAFGTLEFDGVFARAGQVAQATPGLALAITLFLLLGVTGKSAQLPLFVWLPDAMAGPTPVSALIHAATMVTAGVYLVARSSALFVLEPVAQATVAWVGALTALFAATIAVAQNDIKKVLAYSTISQLGFMVAAVGMGAFVAGMFHLVTHAFFKALLFLAAGSLILGLEHAHEQHAGHGAPFDPQDMTGMGGLRSRMPLTFWVYLVGALALAGVAPLAGFFSKDEILAEALHTMPAIFVVLLLAAFLTAFYMGRQVLLVFFGAPRSPAAAHAGESPALVTLPLVVLAVLALLGGALNLPGVHTLETWLEHSLAGVHPGTFVLGVALGSLALALAGIAAAWWLYGRGAAVQPDPLAGRLGGLFKGMQSKWWVDEAYHVAFVRPWQALCAALAGPVDLGVIDGVVNGLARLSALLAGSVRRLQNGFVRSYALSIFLGVVLLLTYLAMQ